MDARVVHEILELYLFTDFEEDDDVKQEIAERIASLSDDPDVEVVITTIDSEHDGIMAEVTEYGQITEYIMSEEIIEMRNTGDPEDE